MGQDRNCPRHSIGCDLTYINIYKSFIFFMIARSHFINIVGCEVEIARSHDRMCLRAVILTAAKVRRVPPRIHTLSGLAG